jgi:hypothetical protein
MVDAWYSWYKSFLKGRGEDEGKFKCRTMTVAGKHYSPFGKAIPVQAWAGPEGSRRLRLPDFYSIGT